MKDAKMDLTIEKAEVSRIALNTMRKLVARSSYPCSKCGK